MKNGICDEFKLRKINNQIIFFSSESSDPEEISLAMYASVSSMKPSTVSLTEMEFNRGFNLVRLKDAKYEQMVASYEKFNQKLEESFCCHIDVAKKIMSQMEHPDEKLNYLLSHFRKTANSLHESLAEKYGKVMEDFEDFTFYITLKSKVMNCIDKLRDFTESFDGTDMITRQLNKILRKCPHCGQIWSKVTGDGCDGNTSCGKKWEGAVDSDPIGFLNFEPKYDQNGNISDVLLRNKENAKGVYSETKGKEVVTQYGCGKTFEWRSAPFLSPGELKKFTDVVSEESLNNITKNVNYEELKKISLKKIDTSFHKVEKNE